MLRLLAWLAVLALVSSCGRPRRICGPVGSTGGVFVAESYGCAVGCDQIDRHDFIVAIDGAPVRGPQDLERSRIADGKTHRLYVRGLGETCARRIEIVAAAEDRPFHVADIHALLRAPDWARRRLFAHASPSVELVGLSGERIEGRSMIGRRHLIVYWDRADRIEEAAAVTFMQVLQKAQADLAAADIRIVFAHVSFSPFRSAAMNVDDLRAWTDRWRLVVNGQPLPDVPTYRAAPPRERERGLAQGVPVLENLGQSPTIVLLDAHGLVRWHSEGVESPPPDASVQNAEQYTIISAVVFALEQL